jgi:dolichol-phosphate mannosyltransferase
MNKKPLVSVVVPTFCEAENLPILIPRVVEALRESGSSCEVIVVDDNSQDGTIEACEQLSQDHPVRLITRQDERGLATAVLCGLEQAEGEVLVVMDADLSHPPESVPQLVAACQSEATDFVIGSRYVTGGSIDDSWSWFRHCNSRVASLLAWGLTSAGDPMAGFFALRSTTFEEAKNVNPLGYKIGLELIVRCECQKVTEVPIVFNDRVHGESKLNLHQQVLYLQHLGRLYSAKYARLAQAVKFGLVGLSGMVVDLFIFMMMLQVTNFAVARVIGIMAAITWNFSLNRRITFRTDTHVPLLRQFGKYCGACAMGASVNWTVSLALCTSVPWFEANPAIAAGLGVVCGAFGNYLLCCRWVFRGRKGKASAGLSKTPPPLPSPAFSVPDDAGEKAA